MLLYGAIALGVSRWGEMRERYVNLTALAAALCCAVALLQLCRVNVLGLYPEGLSFYDAGTRYTGEFLGTMGNTNLLAAWFCLVIPLLTVSALRSRGARRPGAAPAARRGVSGAALCHKGRVRPRRLPRLRGRDRALLCKLHGP